jgi:hypothetical protein
LTFARLRIAGLRTGSHPPWSSPDTQGAMRNPATKPSTMMAAPTIPRKMPRPRILGMVTA